jgi:hypothetical protein
MRYIKLRFSLNRVLTIIAFLSIINHLSSQDKFHRTYPLFDNEHFVFAGDVTQLSNGLYASVDYSLYRDPMNPQDFLCDTLVFTAYKAKGDVEFSFLIPMDKGLYGGINTDIKPSIVEGPDGRPYLHFVTFDGPNGNKHRANIAANGVNIETYTVNDNSDYDFTTLFKASAYSKSLIHAFTAETDDTTGIVLSKKSLPDFPVSAGFVKKYTSSISEFSTVSDMDSRNNRIAVVGNLDSLNNTPYILVTDSTGKVMFSESFFNAQNFGTIIIPQLVRILPDTSYVVAGLEVEPNPVFGIKFNGFVTRFDKNGEILWSKIQTSGADYFDLVKSMTLDRDNSLVITSANVNLFTGLTLPFATKLSALGDEQEKKKYSRMQDAFDLGGSVIPAKSGGVLWTGTQVDPLSQLPVLSLLKLDSDLSSSCEEEFDDEVFFDVEFITDTLEWTVSNQTLSTTPSTTKTEGNQYDIPVLSLNVRPFCPNEPINWLFEVPIEGATFYKWSTGVEGNALDTLRVFETGKYAVTVTIDKDVCFMLCDTSDLERYELPQASLGVSLGNFCTNNKLTINPAYVPGHPQIKSFLWAPGGETTASIEASGPGTYSLTLTDGCDEKALATVTLGEFPKKISAVTVTPQVKFNCSTGQYTGRIEAKGNSTTDGPLGLGVERFKWSNGNSTTNFINIDQNTPVDITVTVTDGCNNTSTGTFQSTATGENLMKPSVIAQAVGCKVRLNAVNEVTGTYTYIWSTGETTASIIVDKDGSYGVTVTDLCNNKSAAIGNAVIPKPDPRIEINKGPLCSTGAINLDAKLTPFSGVVYSFIWSNNSTTPTISIKDPGTYIVTVTDDCGNSATASIGISEEDLKPAAIDFPRVFFPDGLAVFETDTSAANQAIIKAHDANRTFGPILTNQNACPDQIQDYEFFVYNRWNQQVFESTDIKAEWDGSTDDGTKHHTETYIFVSRYNVIGKEIIVKGSINLLR